MCFLYAAKCTRLPLRISGHLVAHLLNGFSRGASDGCSKCVQQSLNFCRKVLDVFVDVGDLHDVASLEYTETSRFRVSAKGSRSDSHCRTRKEAFPRKKNLQKRILVLGQKS